MAVMTILIAGCGGSPEAPAEPASTVDAGKRASAPQPSPILSEFPEGPLPEATAVSLQAVLDRAVKRGTFRGATAAVIVAGSGSWSGAAGVEGSHFTRVEENPLTPDAQLLIASVGKTVTAAQVLRLVEEGKLGLDDPAADHLPPELAFLNTNGATIRDLLGMRSGIPDQPLVDTASTPEPLFPPGSEIAYENINYILLGKIIEHVTGRPLWDVFRSGVLDRPGLDGLVYRVKDVSPADGGGIQSDPTSLARWGYELYGGFVLSEASMRQMTDFQGDWYGLGAIDFSQATPAIPDGYGIPAIGHGGLEPSIAVLLVAFPETGVIVAVQANGGGLEEVATVVGALRVAVQP
jgi:CubicO group peptidase (beta-lactamase class C family)